MTARRLAVDLLATSLIARRRRAGHVDVMNMPVDALFLTLALYC